METKQCSACRVVYTPAADHFHRRTDQRREFRSHCKKCAQLRLLDAKRRYNASDSAREKNRRNKAQNRQRWPSTTEWPRRNKFSINIRQAMAFSLKRRKTAKGGRKLEALLGYSIEDLKRHLERQFKPPMSWSNYGTYWHVDHILPVASFSFDSPDHPDFKACWALTNLRPLKAEDNLKKRALRLHLL